MSKYEPLSEFLGRQSSHSITLTLNEIGRILGQPLPRSAFDYREWWSNQSDTSNRPQSRAWQSAGFEVDSVRLDEQGWVRFRRKTA